LAWAHKSGKKDEQAVQNFKQLAETFPDSPLAPEAHFHVAEDLYAKSKFDAAVSQFNKAATSDDAEVGEKAYYKMAWSHYQQKRYSVASETFGNQVSTFSSGELVDSARFMIAECLFQQKKYKPAYVEFKKIKQTIIESSKTNDAEKSLTCLHGAESANKLREYSDAISFVTTLKQDLKSKLFAAESMLELGNAYRGLKEFDNAIAAFQDASDLSNSETGARAGFLIGEVRFQQKKFEDAIRQYKLVIYGYGGSRASDAVKKWQCSSGYETARCYQVQIKDEQDAAKRKSNIEDALKFFNYVVTNHPSDKLATESKKQIASLKTLK
jgi:TolA-binding protein